MIFAVQNLHLNTQCNCGSIEINCIDYSLMLGIYSSGIDAAMHSECKISHCGLAWTKSNRNRDDSPNKCMR